LIRIFTGHNALFYDRHNIDNEISSICRFCLEEDETSWHVIAECPAFSNPRREILLGMPLRNDGIWKVEEIRQIGEIKDIAMALEGWEFEHDDWRDD
jgi:hypothetical protein